VHQREAPELRSIFREVPQVFVHVFIIYFAIVQYACVKYSISRSAARRATYRRIASAATCEFVF
jgi:hypothetical protein